MFFSNVMYPISDVWVPGFRLANCQSERCLVKPQENKLLKLKHTGQIEYETEMVLRSTCNVDLTCMSCTTNIVMCIINTMA